MCTLPCYTHMWILGLNIPIAVCACSEQPAIMSKHGAIDLATKITVSDTVKAGTRGKTDIANSFLAVHFLLL